MEIKNTQKSRCLIIFEESIQSEETKKNYLLMLNKFRRWSNVEDFDDLLKADEKSIHVIIKNLEKISTK